MRAKMRLQLAVIATALVVGLGVLASMARDVVSEAQSPEGTTRMVSAMKDRADSASDGAPAVNGAPLEDWNTGNHRILLIGDSHSVGGFGTELLSRLAKDLQLGKGSTARFASCGSSTAHWSGEETFSSSCGTSFQWFDDAKPAAKGRVPALSGLLKEKQAAGKPMPGLIIVALGTNPAGACLGPKFQSYTDAVAKAAGSGAACVWVGPPNMRAFSKEELENRYKMIRAAASKSCGSGPCCGVIDSREFTDQGSCDQAMGLHYCPPHDAEWAAGAASRIEAHLKP